MYKPTKGVRDKIYSKVISLPWSKFLSLGKNVSLGIVYPGVVEFYTGVKLVYHGVTLFTMG